MSGVTAYPPPPSTGSTPSRDGSHDQKEPRSRLEEYERGGDSRPPFILNRTEVKLLGIAGIGFFLDGKDNPLQRPGECDINHPSQ
jgi:MFS transporter, PHS family, inorganic phosphate transporter